MGGHFGTIHQFIHIICSTEIVDGAVKRLTSWEIDLWRGKGMEIRKSGKRHLSSALAWLMAGVLTVHTALPVSAGETELAAERIQTGALAASAEPENAQSREASAQAENNVAQPEAPQTEAKPAQPEAPQTETKPAQTEGQPEQSDPAQEEGNPPQSDAAQEEGNPSQSDPAQTEGNPSQPDAAQTEGNPSQSDPAQTEGKPSQPDAAQTETDPSGTEFEAGETESKETEQKGTESETGTETEPETETESEGETEKKPEGGAASSRANLITGWQWIDPEELLVYEEGSEEYPAGWVLCFPGASEEHPASFEDVTELLPRELLADWITVSAAAQPQAGSTGAADAQAAGADSAQTATGGGADTGADGAQTVTGGGADTGADGAQTVTGGGADAGTVGAQTVSGGAAANAADVPGGASGQTQLALADWKCPEYPEEGAWEGCYTFEAQLPEGYVLGADTEALEVMVILGGAELMLELYEATLSIDGGKEQNFGSFESALMAAQAKAPASAKITLCRPVVPTMVTPFTSGNVTITAKDSSAGFVIPERDGAPLFQIAGGTFTLDNVPIVNESHLTFMQIGVENVDGDPTVNIINTNIPSEKTAISCMKGTLNISGSSVIEATGSNSCALHTEGATVSVSGSAQLRASGSAGAVQVVSGNVDISGSTKIECSGNGMGALTITGGDVKLRDSASVSAANDNAVQIGGGSLSISDRAAVTSTSGVPKKANGVSITGGTVSIAGGTITAKQHSSSCAVYASGNGSVEITGGSMEGKFDGVDMYGGQLHIGGNAVIKGSYVLEVHSGRGDVLIEGGKMEGIGGGIDLHNDASDWNRTVTIQGGEVSASGSRSYGLIMTGSKGVVLKGGTYNGGADQGGSISLLADNLGKILADGYAYFKGSTPIEGKLSAKVLSEKPVTVKPCTHPHAGNWQEDGSGGAKGTCLACGREVSAEAAVSGDTVTYYTHIEDAWAAAKQSGSPGKVGVILVADAEVSEPLTVENGESIRLEGGRTLQNRTGSNPVFRVSGGDLLLFDIVIESAGGAGVEQTGGNVKVDGKTTVSGTCGFCISGAAALQVTGGTVTGSSSHGIQMNGGSVSVTGGNVTGSSAAGNYACYMADAPGSAQTLTVEGGTLGACRGIRGGAGSVTISGGEITGTDGSFYAGTGACKIHLTGGTFQRTNPGEVNIDLRYSGGAGKFRDILAEGYAFFENGNPVAGLLDQSTLSKASVTVKKCETHTWGAWKPNTEGVYERSCECCGKTEAAVVSVTAGSTTDYFADIRDAWDAAGEAGEATVALLQDVSCDSTLSVEEGMKITLTAVNGRRLEKTGTGSFLEVSGSLILDNIVIQGEKFDEESSAVRVTGGSLTVRGSSVRNNGEAGAGIAVNSGSVTLESGAFVSSDQAGLRISGGSVTITGGIILGSQSGVDMSGGSLTMTGGMTLGVQAGIYISGGEALVTGGQICSDTVGVSVSGGRLTVSEGTIEGETGGLLLDSQGTAFLSGGTFRAAGGGIRITAENPNTLGSLLEQRCVYYAGEGTGGLITGKLEEKELTDVCVTVKRCPHAWEAWNPSADDPAAFHRTCQYCGAEETMKAVAIVTAAEDVTPYADMAQAWAAAKEANTAAVTLLADVSCSDTLTVDADETITLNSAEGACYSITGTAGSCVFEVTGSLTLNGSRVDSNSCAISQVGGSLRVDGAEINGGLEIHGGTTVLESGTISSPREEGVMLDQNASMFVKGGTVTGTGNRAFTLSGYSRLAVDGGQITGKYNGIMAQESSSVEILNGSVGLSEFSADGAAVVLNTASDGADKPSLSVSGGTLDGTDGDAAAAVFCGSAVITGGSFISNRTAALRLTGGETEVSGGTFTANNAGCALLAEGGSAEVSGGTFNGWIASVTVKGSGSLKADGGAFTARSGPALSVEGGSAEVSGGTFDGKNYGLHVGAAGSVILSGGVYKTGQYYMIYCENGKAVKELLAEGCTVYWGDQVLAQNRLLNNELEVSELMHILSSFDTVTVGPDTASPQERISVDLTWGAMEFTYTDSVWNTETHTCEGGGWTCAEGADRITAVNTGTLPVKIGCSYSQTDTAVTGQFLTVENRNTENRNADGQSVAGLSAEAPSTDTGSGGKEAEVSSTDAEYGEKQAEARSEAVLARLGEGERLEQQLVLTGRPSTEGKNLALGTVTVTIQPVQRAWLELPEGWGWNPMIYAYCMDENGKATNYSGWPGVPMTADQHPGYFYWDIPEGFENCLVIFYSDDWHRYPADGEPGLPMNGSSMIYNGAAWERYGE